MNHQNESLNPLVCVHLRAFFIFHISRYPNELKQKVFAAQSFKARLLFSPLFWIYIYFFLQSNEMHVFLIGVSVRSEFTTLNNMKKL